MKYQNYIEGGLGKSHKNLVKGGSKLDTGVGCEISQPAKFCRLRNFRNPAKFMQCSKFYPFLLHFPSDF